jgi:hypothetical protein
MRRLTTTILGAAAILVAAVAFAQGPGRGFGAPTLGVLLTNKGVQEELKMSDDQKKKVGDIVQNTRDKYKDDLKDAGKDKEKRAEITKKMNDEMAKPLAEALKPEQLKRAKQIEIQAGGFASLSREDVQKDLKLTDKQKGDIKDMAKDIEKDSGELFKGAGKDKDKFKEAMDKVQKMNADSLEKVAKGFTDDQKKAWKDMTGEKFNYVPEFGGKGKDK